MFKKVSVVIVATVLLVAGLAVGGSASGHEQKVWVCKFVGTPGVDEVLKKGNDGLIEVSPNSLNPHGPVAVGDEFPDKHGRSVVVQIGGTKPDASVCTPTPTPEPEPTVTPEPQPEPECPEGMVPGAPNEDGVFACQNNDALSPNDNTPQAPKPAAVPANPTFTG